MQILSKDLTRFPGVNVRIDVKEGNQRFHNTVHLPQYCCQRENSVL